MTYETVWQLLLAEREGWGGLMCEHFFRQERRLLRQIDRGLVLTISGKNSKITTRTSWLRTWMLRKMLRLTRRIRPLWISLRRWIFSLTMLRCVHAIYIRLKDGRRRLKLKIQIGRGYSR